MTVAVETKEKVAAGLITRIGSLLRDRRGTGAVEFAIIAPILLMIYITCFELTIGLSVSKRATRAAASVADIVTQDEVWDKTKLATMLDVTSAMFSPYSTTGLKLRISGVAISPAKKATIAWSWAQDGSKPYAVGTAVTIPTDMNYADTFLVHTELTIPHELLMFMPSLVPSQSKSITIAREYFFRNRTGSKVQCEPCT